MNHVKHASTLVFRKVLECGRPLPLFRRTPVLTLSILLWLSSPIAWPSQTVINTLAGYSGQSSADGTGSNARFFQPLGAAIDSAGNIFVAHSANHTIRSVSP